MKSPFVLRKTLEKDQRESGKFIVRMTGEYDTERKGLKKEIKELRKSLYDQKWYRETWEKLIQESNTAGEKQMDTLVAILKLLGK